MSRFLLITIFSLACLTTQAQTILPNMNFEDWQQSTSMQPYWICLPTTTWATGNPAATITANYPTYRTLDAQNGTYAACLETKNIFGVIAAGNLFTGWFESAMFDSQAHFGVPFTGKPDAFQGWYKYDSFSYDGTPDECAIYAILSRWDGSQRVEIARAELYNGNDVTEYTYFNLPFVYVNALTPDTISVVFSSSRNGASFEGAVGSKLFIDNINLFYDLSPVQNLNIGNKTVVFAYDSQHQTLNVMRSTTQTATVELFDITGKKLRSWQLDNTSHELPCTNMIPGVYVCRYSVSGEKPVVSKLYIN